MNKFDKELALRIMLLLSALESWAYSTKTALPEHTQEELGKLMFELREEVLK